MTFYTYFNVQQKHVSEINSTSFPSQMSQCRVSPNFFFFGNPTIKTNAPSWGAPPFKNEAPHNRKTNPPLKNKAHFQDMIPKKH